eukprot:COSAG01_NODE_1995_length_8691_cov_62.212989_8_plen_390_part_00
MRCYGCIDLRNVSASSKKILLNAGAISVSQDPLGRMGTRLPTYTSNSSTQVWVRLLANGDIAVACYNKGQIDPSNPRRPTPPEGKCGPTKDGLCPAANISFTFDEIGFTGSGNGTGFVVRDLWTHRVVADMLSGSFTARSVPHHGTALFRVSRKLRQSALNATASTWLAVSSSQSCMGALDSLCPRGASGSSQKCNDCVGEHQAALRHAGCSISQVQAWCTGTPSGCTFKDKTAITAVQYQWAARGSVAHSGLTWQTAGGGSYALAYNSLTVPGIGFPAGLWCQTGGMPMKNTYANGDCKNCGGWHTTDSKKGQFMSNSAFLTKVVGFYYSHPVYSLKACSDHLPATANCQSTAAHLYKALTGSKPSTSGCPTCKGKNPTSPCCASECK